MPIRRANRRGDGTDDTDHHSPRESYGSADQQPAWKALTEQNSGEDSDEYGADLDEHRRRRRVDALFGGVERDVVDREPEHPDAEDLNPLRTVGFDPSAPREHECAQDEAADQQPAERERLTGFLGVPPRPSSAAR